MQAHTAHMVPMYMYTTSQSSTNTGTQELALTTQLWFTDDPLSTYVVQQHVPSLSRALEPCRQVVEQVTHLLRDDIIVDLRASLSYVKTKTGSYDINTVESLYHIRMHIEAHVK